MKFVSRKQAGYLLAKKLKEQIKDKKIIVCGITRGGLIVAKEIADQLSLPLYPIVVKKIGALNHPELAIGALTYNQTTFIDWDLVKKLDIPINYLNSQIKVKLTELKQLANQFGKKKKIPLSGKNIILVDDGIATGSTVMAVLKYLKTKKVKKIILAVPVIATDTYHKIKNQVNQLLALEISDSLIAIGQFYEFFPQVDNKEVLTIVN